MKCKICGSKLANENADICLNCYKKYQEEEDLKKDVNEKLVVKRRYKISYILLKWLELILIFILTILAFIAYSKFLEAFLCFLICAGIMIVILAFSKRIAKNTRAVFYDKKVVYTSKNLFYNTQKVLKYTDLKDISIYQSHRQRKSGFGDIIFYTKSTVPGASFFKGFQIKDVENVKQVIPDIVSITGLGE
jgi:uncharacterized membrane protein YdbT with pleckstrin-like domain